MIIALLLMAIYTNMDAQVYIWGGPGDKNSEFDGGLNDWTTEGFTADANCANPVANDNAKWEWDANGATKGAFSSSRGKPNIMSPSIANGAAVFDSDYKDNGGNGNNTGKGPAPTHQLGYLTSPVFSCKDHHSVVVRFNHHRLNFYSDFYLEVTNDGGVTWNTIDLNDDGFAVNRITHTFSANDAATVEMIDISKYAADKDNVQIRFKICGNYYYWVIDDVYVMEQVEDNIVLGDCFYPSTQYARPGMSLSNDTAFFSCYVANVGTANNDSVNVTAILLDFDNRTPVFSTEKTVAIASGDTLRIDFDDYFITKDLAVDKNYAIIYRLNNADANTTDNFYGQFMVINDGAEYQKLNKELRANTGYRPTSAEGYAFGLPFQTGDAGQDYLVKSVEVGIVGAGNALAEPDNVVEAYLLEFNENDPYFNIENFFGGDFSSIDIENDFYSVVGYGVKPLTDGVENWSLFTIPMENDVDPDQPLRLESNKLYVLAMNVVQTTSDNIWVLFSLNNLEMHNFENIFPKAQLSYITYTDTWRGAFNNVNTPPFCTIELEHDPIATKQPELPESAVNVSPNPAVDKFVVEYSFKEATSGELVLTTNDGKVINRRPLNNVQSGVETYRASEMPAGQYLMNVKTKIGSRTVPIIVQK